MQAPQRGEERSEPRDRSVSGAFWLSINGPSAYSETSLHYRKPGRQYSSPTVTANTTVERRYDWS